MSNEVSRSEFARRNGWAPSYVTKLADHGRLVLTPDGRRVLVRESMELIAATKGNRDDVADRHADGRRAGATPEGAAPGAAAAPESAPPPDQNLAQAKRVKAISEARRIAALADQEEMNRDTQAGALIAREDVEFVMNDFGATVRRLLENLPDQIAHEVYPLTTLDATHAKLSEACEWVMAELSESMKRRAKEMT